MSKVRSVVAAYRLLLLCSAVSVTAIGASHAQEADVKAAVASFDAAIGALDWTRMEPLWARNADITLVLPESQGVAIGPEAVKQTFGGEFQALAELKVTELGAPVIHIKGDAAWVTRLTNGKGKTKSGFAFDEATFDSAIYEKRDGSWLLVSKTALRAAVPK